MKKAVILSERQAALVEAPIPQPEGDEALVKVHVTPMCTEYKALAERPAGRVPGPRGGGRGRRRRAARPC